MPPLHGPVPLLHDYLIGAAAQSADKVALVCMKQRLTYRGILVPELPKTDTGQIKKTRFP